MNNVRVLLADDHAILRSGLRLLLDREPGIVVAGEAGDGNSAVDWMRREQADVAVMDVAMPGLNGIEATARIIRNRPSTRIVILSMHSDETYVLRCLRAGAHGYVLKESAEYELISAIRAVMNGRSFFSPKVSLLLQREHVQRVRQEGGEDLFELLTPREREVLQLLGEGHGNKQIAGCLNLSVFTVETHRKRILEKLHLHGAAELTLYCVRKGIIQAT